MHTEDNMIIRPLHGGLKHPVSSFKENMKSLNMDVPRGHLKYTTNRGSEHGIINIPK